MLDWRAIAAFSRSSRATKRAAGPREADLGRVPEKRHHAFDGPCRARRWIKAADYAALRLINGEALLPVASAPVLERLRRRKYVLDVPLHLYLPPLAGDAPLAIDQKRRALDAHVLPSVHVLLAPHPVGVDGAA